MYHASGIVLTRTSRIKECHSNHQDMGLLQFHLLLINFSCGTFASVVGHVKFALSILPYFYHQSEVASEGETGKVFRANFHDRHGRTVLILRPGKQVFYFV